MGTGGFEPPRGESAGDSRSPAYANSATSPRETRRRWDSNPRLRDCRPLAFGHLATPSRSPSCPLGRCRRTAPRGLFLGLENKLTPGGGRAKGKSEPACVTTQVISCAFRFPPEAQLRGPRCYEHLGSRTFYAVVDATVESFFARPPLLFSAFTTCITFVLRPCGPRRPSFAESTRSSNRVLHRECVPSFCA